MAPEMSLWSDVPTSTSQHQKALAISMSTNVHCLTNHVLRTRMCSRSDIVSCSIGWRPRVHAILKYTRVLLSNQPQYCKYTCYKLADVICSIAWPPREQATFISLGVRTTISCHRKEFAI